MIRFNPENETRELALYRLSTIFEVALEDSDVLQAYLDREHKGWRGGTKPHGSGKLPDCEVGITAHPARPSDRVVLYLSREHAEAIQSVLGDCWEHVEDNDWWGDETWDHPRYDI